MRHVGLEFTQKPANPSGKWQISQTAGAKASLAVCPPVPANADLRAVVEAWPTLPPGLRAGILAIVRAAK
jgi:hypothetical protein